jgi:hypothetical protein
MPGVAEVIVIARGTSTERLASCSIKRAGKKAGPGVEEEEEGERP